MDKCMSSTSSDPASTSSGPTPASTSREPARRNPKRQATEPKTGSKSRKQPYKGEAGGEATEAEAAKKEDLEEQIELLKELLKAQVAEAEKKSEQDQRARQQVEQRAKQAEEEAKQAEEEAKQQKRAREQAEERAKEAEEKVKQEQRARQQAEEKAKQVERELASALYLSVVPSSAKSVNQYHVSPFAYEETALLMLGIACGEQLRSAPSRDSGAATSAASAQAEESVDDAMVASKTIDSASPPGMPDCTPHGPNFCWRRTTDAYEQLKWPMALEEVARILVQDLIMVATSWSFVTHKAAHRLTEYDATCGLQVWLAKGNVLCGKTLSWVHQLPSRAFASKHCKMDVALVDLALPSEGLAEAYCNVCLQYDLDPVPSVGPSRNVSRPDIDARNATTRADTSKPQKKSSRPRPRSGGSGGSGASGASRDSRGSRGSGVSSAGSSASGGSAEPKFQAPDAAIGKLDELLRDHEDVACIVRSWRARFNPIVVFEVGIGTTTEKQQELYTYAHEENVAMRVHGDPLQNRATVGIIIALPPQRVRTKMLTMEVHMYVPCTSHVLHDALVYEGELSAEMFVRVIRALENIMPTEENDGSWPTGLPCPGDLGTKTTVIVLDGFVYKFFRGDPSCRRAEPFECMHDVFKMEKLECEGTRSIIRYKYMHGTDLWATHSVSANAFAGLLQQLVHAHTLNWCHCDVRAKNIVVSEGKLYLIDWEYGVKIGEQLCAQLKPVSDAPYRIRHKTTVQASCDYKALAGVMDLFKPSDDKDAGQWEKFCKSVRNATNVGGVKKIIKMLKKDGACFEVAPKDTPSTPRSSGSHGAAAPNGSIYLDGEGSPPGKTAKNVGDDGEDRGPA
eukprot:TRINITY_DN1065_c0_g1_i3.p1 TRINITY_DN1065_c0_g1~~TRINITY_DN1065_c0_g1_i3.p1  ORF type:complete len:851 (-),score=146.43 TRINITY_DN1065_c0_g1_i3:363-2915(-)